MSRQRISSGAPWEESVGYSRAIRTGSHVHVSGTTATDEEGNVIGKGDPKRQTEIALEIVETALEAADASLEDVVRTRLFVTDIEHHESIGTAHGAVFGKIKPATTMVEVNQLIDPEMLVEIEATAIVDE